MTLINLVDNPLREVSLALISYVLIQEEPPVSRAREDMNEWYRCSPAAVGHLRMGWMGRALLLRSRAASLYH